MSIKIKRINKNGENVSKKSYYSRREIKKKLNKVKRERKQSKEKKTKKRKQWKQRKQRKQRKQWKQRGGIKDDNILSKHNARESIQKNRQSNKADTKYR